MSSTGMSETLRKDNRVTVTAECEIFQQQRPLINMIPIIYWVLETRGDDFYLNFQCFLCTICVPAILATPNFAVLKA